MEPKTLRLGISPCPNDVFIFSGIIDGCICDPALTFDIDYQDVQTLNERASLGAYDAVKISYAAYPTIAAYYELLECGGALGRNCGPLLLAHGESALNPSREVLVPGKATTANFLLDFFTSASTLDRLDKRFLSFDALYDELTVTPGAQGVVIHEKRFTYAADGLMCVQDLGAFWEANTGHPIPLGAIAVRRSLGIAGTLSGLIRESLSWAEANRDRAVALCRESAQDLSDGVIESHIGLYVNQYSHDLGVDGRAAVAYLLRRLAARP